MDELLDFLIGVAVILMAVFLVLRAGL